MSEGSVFSPALFQARGENDIKEGLVLFVLFEDMDTEPATCKQYFNDVDHLV